VLKKENFNLPLTPLDTPAITPILATAYLINIPLTLLASLKPKKKVRFTINYFVRLFPITRAYAIGSLELVVLELAAKPARLILLPKRAVLILPLTIKNLFTKGYKNNKELSSILEALRTRQSRYKRITLAECVEREGYLYYRDRLYAPNNPKLHTKLLQMYYESPVASYIGRSRTYEALS
jgi:hypothetical protein